MGDHDGRMTDIETAVAHQQAALDELSDVVREQAALIDLLARRIVALEAALDAAGPPQDAGARPPHW